MQAQVAQRDGVPRILAEIRDQGDLAANPQAIERLNQVLNKEYCTTLGLAHAILQDPGLSAKILRVVNSVAYSVRGEAVSTITRAIVLIGFERVREIATGLLLIEQFTRAHGGNAPVRENLRRALRCALTAQAIAAQVGQVAPERAYLLGLFANLGLLWLAAYYPDVLERALVLERAGTASLDEALQMVAGVSSNQLAAEVLRHWSLPDTYVHHFQRRGGDLGVPATTSDRLSAVVDVADAYARAIEHEGVSEDARDEKLLARFERTFALPGLRLLDALEAVKEELSAQTRMLGIATGAERGAATSGTRPGAARAATTASAGAATSPLGPLVTGAPAPRAEGGDAALAIDVAVEVTGSILVDDDVNHNLTAVVEGVARSGPYDAVVLGLVNRARDRVAARLCYGPGIEADMARLDVPLRRGSGLLAETVLDAAPRIVESATAAQLVAPGTPAPRVAVRSLLLQPLVVRGSAIGVLVALRSGGTPVGRADLPVVQMFCNLACIALREMLRR